MTRSASAPLVISSSVVNSFILDLAKYALYVLFIASFPLSNCIAFGVERLRLKIAFVASSTELADFDGIASP